MDIILFQSSYTLLIGLLSVYGKVNLIGFLYVSDHSWQICPSGMKPVSSVYIYLQCILYNIHGVLSTVHIHTLYLARSRAKWSSSRGSEETTLARSCPDDYGGLAGVQSSKGFC